MLPGLGRHRRLPADPRRVRRADRDAHRQDRHRGRRARPGVRCRRLRGQAVQAEGTGRPGPRRLRRTDEPRAGDAGRSATSTIDVAGHSVTPRRADDHRSPRSSSTCWSRWPASRGRSSPARCCSSRSGATGTPRTPGWSTCTCSGSRSKIEKDPERPEIVRDRARRRLQGGAGLTSVTPRAGCGRMRAGRRPGRASRVRRPTAWRAGRLLLARWRTTPAARLLRFGRAARRRWRRSLQLRVVTTTMLLGSVVIVALAVSSCSTGISERPASTRREVALRRGGPADRRAPRTASATQRERRRQREQPDPGHGATRLQGPGRRAGTRCGPGARGDSRRCRWATTVAAVTGGVGVETCATQTCAAEVNSAGPGSRASGSHCPRPSPRRRGAPVPALGVGSIVNVPLARRYELYFVFRLEPRAWRSSRLVQRTLRDRRAVALVLLVGAVGACWSPVRWSRPVRQAAQTAEELASGRLDRRMQVRGEDDLARLAGRSTRWLPAWSARSTGWRSCPACSGGSSPTSRTSCARHSPRSGWPAR